jgi:6-pyruvoyltetrahydropterin/6-carboxytetrahydropterin synthase
MSLATISKEFDFSAAHHLRGLHPDHPCSRVHGHNYIIRLELTGYTDEVGFVLDYRALGFFKDMIRDEIDHRDLNKVMGEDFNPTSENLAHEFLDLIMATLKAEHRDAFDRLTEVKVHISETPKTWCVATSTRHCDFPSSKAEEERAADHWDGHAVSRDVADRITGDAPPLDPHEADGDRYRWNFDHDGSGK